MKISSTPVAQILPPLILCFAISLPIYSADFSLKSLKSEIEAMKSLLKGDAPTLTFVTNYFDPDDLAKILKEAGSLENIADYFDKSGKKTALVKTLELLDLEKDPLDSRDLKSPAPDGYRAYVDAERKIMFFISDNGRALKFHFLNEKWFLQN